MNLSQYEGCRVVIETDNKKIFLGRVIDYLRGDENENGRDSIVVRDERTNALVEFYEKDIKTIEVTG